MLLSETGNECLFEVLFEKTMICFLFLFVNVAICGNFTVKRGLGAKFELYNKCFNLI